MLRASKEHGSVAEMKPLRRRAPRRRTIEAGLRRVTEALARELAETTERPPDWSELEWRLAPAVAAIHGVSPLLSGCLQWSGPAAWRKFLKEQRAHTAARHSRIEALLGRIDECARADGVSAVALKGAELHARRFYVPGERPMSDVDLLVRGTDVQGAARMLERLGFHESFSTWKHRVFVTWSDRPPADLGEHADNPLKIELHERLREALPLYKEDITASVFPVTAHPGLNPYPSKAALMLHLVHHAAGTIVSRGLRLMHLNDLARLSVAMTDADWDELLALRRGPGRGLWWAWPPLAITARYNRSVVPGRVLTALAADCPPILRRAAARSTLSDVSLSSARVSAYRGVEWSRSVGEATRCMARRVWPDAEVLEVRKHLARTEVSLRGSRWSELSQGRRVLRWLLSRPLRPETMHAVRTVLEWP